MRQYPSYKDSGVEWIGEIPKGWDVQRLKYTSSILPSNVDKHIYPNEIQVRLCNYTDVYYNEFITPSLALKKGSCNQNEFNKFKLRKGDVIITKDSESADDIGIPTLTTEDLDDVVCGYHLTLIRPINVVGGFLFRFIQSDRTRKYFEINSDGVTRFGLGKPAIQNMAMNIPPLQEQQQISNYLDGKTQQVDSLIEKTGQKIELLKEQRTALINQVVTKGLDPDAEMKDSGVEWIGEIPKGWRIIPSRFLGEFQNGIVEGRVQSDEVERDRYSVLRGDVFFTRTSESTNDIGVSAVCLETLYESVFSGFVIRLRFTDNTHIPEYSRYHFQTHWKKVFIESKMNIVTRSSLSQQVLGQLSVLIPSLQEQQQIVDYLDNETTKIDSLIEKETKRIELLKEYRQALISEVVTGKVDVRKEEAARNYLEVDFEEHIEEQLRGSGYHIIPPAEYDKAL